MTANRMSTVEIKDAIVKCRKSGLELWSYVPTDFEFAESFGGGSEFVPFSRPTLWPFSLIRLFGQEE